MTETQGRPRPENVLRHSWRAPSAARRNSRSCDQRRAANRSPLSGSRPASSAAGPFEVTLPSSIASIEGSNSFLMTTCLAHRMRPSEISKLRSARKGDRRLLFEALRQRKLAAAPAGPQPTEG